MPRKRKSAKKNGAGESTLTKGHLRKLNALRKSLGDEIAERAFNEWLETQGSPAAGDKYAEVIEQALMPLIDEGKLRIPRGGYVLRRGRGRVILERPE